MSADKIPPLTAEDEARIKQVMDEIPWAVGVDPNPEPTEDELTLDGVVGDLSRAPHVVVENAWRDRIAAAMKTAGYADVRAEHPVSGGRADLTFSRYAIEIDWAAKWAESIGQALYYALCLSSKAVSLLLVEGPKDDVYVDHTRRVANNNTPPLQVWVFNVKTQELDMGDGRTLHVN